MSSSVSYKWKKKDRKRTRKPYDRPYNQQPWYLKYKLESYLPNWVVNVKNYFLTNVANEADENNINEENGGFSGTLLDTRPARVLGGQGENDENEEVDEEEEEDEEDQEEEEEEEGEDGEEDAEEELEDKLDVPDTEEEEVVIQEQPPKPAVKELSKYDFKVNFNKMKSTNLGISELPDNTKISKATAQRFSGKRKLELGPITNPIPSTSRGITNEVRDEEGSSSSENTTSSTSGCSSLVQFSNYQQKISLPLDKNKTELLRKELMKSTRDVAVETDNKPSLSGRDDSRRSLLWSHSPSSRFNVSKFTSPTSVIPRGINSPYYEGKTTFGGTSAKRARLAGSINKLISPTNLTSSVKIQLPNRSSDNVKKVNSEDLLSDAAKRILANIEKISSPLEDAKKIPVYGSIDTSKYLNEPRRTSTIRTPYARPVKSVPYPSLKSSLVPIEKPQLKWAVASRETDTIDSTDSNEQQQQQQASGSSYGFSTGDRNSGGSEGGKIRTNKKRYAYSSNRYSRGKSSGDSSNLFEKIQAPELPNVPFNITSLPSFSFGKPSVASPSSVSQSEEAANIAKDKDLDIVESRVKPTTTIEVVESESEKENKLHESDFSIPVPLKEKPVTISSSSPSKGETNESSNKVVRDDMVVPKSDSVKGSTPQVISSRSKISADAALAAVEDKLSEENQEIKVIESIKTQPETSDQSSNLLVEEEGSSSQVTSDKSVDKQLNVGKSSESLFSKFKPPPGSWMCEECFVQNKPADLKCIACETVKKGSMAPPSSSTPLINATGFVFPTPAARTSTTSEDGFKMFAPTATTVKPSEQSSSAVFGSKPITLQQTDDQKSQAPSTSITATTPASSFTFAKPSTESNVKTTEPSSSSPLFSSPLSTETSSGVVFKPIETTKQKDSSSLFGSGETSKDQADEDLEASPSKRKLELISGGEKDSSSDKSSSEKPSTGMFAFGSETLFSSKPPTFGSIAGEKPSINFQFPKPAEVKRKEEQSPSQSISNTSNCSMSVEVLDDKVSEDDKKKTASPKFSLFSSATTPVSQPSSTNLFTFGAQGTPSLSSSSTTPVDATKTTSSGFTFGSDSKKSITSGFSFASGSENKLTTPSPAFSFGKTTPIVTTTTTTSTPSSSFIFGGASESSIVKTSTDNQSSTSGALAFSKTVTTQSSTIQPSSNAFAFSKPSTTSQSFKFGQSNPIGDTAPSSSGQSKPPVFAFGPSSSSGASSFPLATTTQSASTTSNTLSSPSTGGFSFGSPSTNSFNFTSKPAAATSSGFQFDLSKSNTSTAPSVTSASTSSSTASTFAFGSAPSSGPTTTGGFSFGQTPSTNGGNNSAFVFGSSPSNAPPSLVTPSIQPNAFGPFSFGATPSAPQSQAPASSATGSSNVFAFGSPSTTNHTQSSSAAPAINFETQVQPNFNFLNSTPTQGQPFRFAAETSNSTGAVAVQRNFKKAKRRLPRN